LVKLPATPVRIRAAKHREFPGVSPPLWRFVLSGALSAVK
jgi:hypothetical protein